MEDDQDYEGRVVIIDVQTGNYHVDEMKKFLKEAQQIREKIVAIEGLVGQIRGYHGSITGSAARNEGMPHFLKLFLCFTSTFHLILIPV